MSKQTHKAVEKKVESVEAAEAAEVPVKKAEVAVKKELSTHVTVHVPFQVHINGEPYLGNHKVTRDVAEVLIEMIQRRKANELAAVEGRIKNILRAADGRIIIQDKGAVS